MKIDFLFQQLFFCMYNAMYMDHVDCSFLYETLRSKLNLFIQISLNAPPPPKKKTQAQHICFLRRKLFSSVHVLLRSACRFSQRVISLKIMSLGKVNKKSDKGRLSRWCILLWCIRNWHHRFGFKWSLFSPASTLSDRSPKFYDTFRPNFFLKHDVCFYFEPGRCLYDYSSFEC